MSDIHFEQTDNVWARVRCEDSIAQELCDHFTYVDPSAKFRPKLPGARTKWNGKTFLFSFRTHKILAGLFPYVQQFAKDHNYTFSYKLHFGDVTLQPRKEHVKPWNIPEKLAPRDYQWVAYLWSLTKKRGVIISPTASGKSLIIYMISRWLLEHGHKKRGLLIVPTTSLVEQMYGDFKDYGWDVEKNCQRIYEGFTRDAYAPMVISTWQSIFNLPKKYFAQFDFVIGDEAHQFKASSLKGVMTQLVNCDYRIGTTGTLDGSKVHKLVLEGLFGNVQRVATTKNLMDRGLLAKLEIKCLVLKYPEEVCKTVKGQSYPDEISFLCANESRNRFITNLARSLDGNTLILYNYVDKHGKILYEQIKQALIADPTRKVHLIHGLVETEERELVRKITETEKNSVIVASYGTFSTGTNIKNLHNGIFSSPTKSQIRTLQSLGRGLRMGEFKQEFNLYDIVDDLRYDNYVNFALRHYEERVRIYNEEKFSIKSVNIGLR
jgi:superfamily II DNA or RNA helicase